MGKIITCFAKSTRLNVPTNNSKYDQHTYNDIEASEIFPCTDDDGFFDWLRGVLCESNTINHETTLSKRLQSHMQVTRPTTSIPTAESTNLQWLNNLQISSKCPHTSQPLRRNKPTANSINPRTTNPHPSHQTNQSLNREVTNHKPTTKSPISLQPSSPFQSWKVDWVPQRTKFADGFFDYRMSISVGYTEYSSFHRHPILFEPTNTFHPTR